MRRQPTENQGQDLHKELDHDGTVTRILASRTVEGKIVEVI